MAPGPTPEHTPRQYLDRQRIAKDSRNKTLADCDRSQISVKPCWAEGIIDWTKRAEYSHLADEAPRPADDPCEWPSGPLLGSVEEVGCRWDAEAECYDWQFTTPAD